MLRLLSFAFVVVCMLLSNVGHAQGVREKLDRLGQEDRRWVDDACRVSRELGPSSYVSCVERELEGLKRLGGASTAPQASQAFQTPSQPTYDQIPGLTRSTKPTQDKSNAQSPKLIDVGQACLDGATLRVKSKQSLRADPDVKSGVVQLLIPTHDLVVLDVASINGWCRVVEVSSGNTGWVQQSRAAVAPMARVERSRDVFARTEAAGLSKPTVQIKNDANQTISLEVGGKILQILSQRTESMEIDPGDYKFHATAAGTRPLLGTQTFSSGGAYSWRFWIERRRQ